METYDLGDMVRLYTEEPFSDGITEDAMDPDVVKLVVKNNSGTTVYVYGTDAEIVRDAVGEYHADISVDVEKTWYYAWVSTGDGQAVDEKRFFVRKRMAVEEEA